MKRLFYLSALLIFTSSIQSQNQNTRPSVFLDCQTNCFLTFLRQEVTFIDYKRERQGAEIYALATSQQASAGAREVQLIFVYKDEGLPTDTLKYIRPANISEDEERRLFMKHFKQGILPVLVNSDIREYLDFEVTLPFEEEQLPEEDPWNYWSFDVTGNLNLNGEQTFEEQRYFGRLSGSRVTEDAKFFIGTWYNFNKSKFTLSDSSVVESSNERIRAFTQYVISIDDHWSVGARAFAGSSTFGNIDFEATLRPAIEYNIYPYQDNSTRRLTFLYAAGPVHNNYTELTIFNKEKETLWRQSLDVEYALTQKWGNISVELEFDQFLHDLNLFSISFNPEFELNIVKGLSLNFGAFLSYVGDRINISKGDISDQDIILQNRQLDTSYSFNSFVGFNYRFGSKNNNIVNPRF